MSDVAELAIEVSALRVRRGGRDVLHDVDLAVPRGAVVGLLGPSGCGKTTLMRSIVGVQVVHGGSVRVLGLRAGAAALRRRVGYVMQNAGVYEDLTARQNIAYFRRILGVPAAEVDRVLAAADLTAAADRLVRDLSGGQRSRVSLAVALLGSPEVLVLDEPTVGLDPVLRSDLWQTFRSLAQTGMTLLISSHVMDEAERCDSLVLMRDGRVLAEDTPAGLLHATGAANAEAAFLAIVERDRPSAATGSR